MNTPRGYDGAVLIYTEMNITGAEQGTRALKAEMGKLADSVQNSEDKMAQAFASTSRRMQDAAKDISDGGKASTEALSAAGVSGKKAMAGLLDSITTGMGAAEGKLSAAFSEIPGMASAALSSLPAIAGVAFSGLAAAGIAGLSILMNVIGKFAGRIAGIGKKIVLVVARIAKALLSLKRNAEDTAKGFGMNAGLMLVLSVAMNKISQALSQMTGGIREGMDNLVRYSDRANAAVSGLYSSLETFKNGLAAAIEPVMDIVVPALTKLVNLFSLAAAYVNQFLSALTGKRTYIKAVELQKDYAESLEDSEKETKKLTKETERFLAPFDQIIQLRKTSGEAGDSSGSAADKDKMPKPSEMFELVEIEDDIQRFADKLLDLFRLGDFTGLGRFLGDTINSAIAKIGELIDWNNIGGKITDIVTKFTTLFNSLVASIRWEDLGRTLGKGVNTLVNTLLLLINGIDWVKVGAALASGLNGLVHEVDWTRFGQLLGSYIQMKIDALYGFVTTADWPGIGAAIGNSLMGLVNRIDWARFGETLGRTLSGIISTVHNFIKTIDWRGLGYKIASTINNFFASVNWADFGATLSDIALGLLNMLQTAIEHVDWWQIGEDIGTFLANIDWQGIFNKALQIGIRALAALIQVEWGTLEGLGKKLWDGFTGGISKQSDRPDGWIRQHITEPFLTGLRVLFGINGGISGVMLEMGGHLINGLIGGLDSSKLGAHILAIGLMIKTRFQESFNGIREVVVSAMNAVIDVLNRLQVKIPEWVPELGGKTFGFNIKHIGTSGTYTAQSRFSGVPVYASYAAIPFRMPRLATGTVVPPRAGEFAAILGDNKRETEVVSPLSTMKQALIEALQEAGVTGNNQTVKATLEVDGTRFGQLIAKFGNQENQRVGVRLVTEGRC